MENNWTRKLKALGACSEAIEYAKQHETFSVAWEQCERGDWMLWLAGKITDDRKALVKAACECARLALPYVRKGELRPLRAIVTAEAWTRGEATIERIKAAASSAASSAAAYTVSSAVAYDAAYAAVSSAAASSAAYAASAAAAAYDAASSAASSAAYAAAYTVSSAAAYDAASSAAYAASAAAAAYDAASSAAYAAASAAYDAAYAAVSSSSASAAARLKTLKQCADIARRHYVVSGNFGLTKREDN
jgi:hypothetical protein